MDMLRVWPLVIQFGVGGAMCAVGLYCGLSSGYLDKSSGTARRVVGVTVAGYLALLALMSFFTFVAPFWGEGDGQ